MLPRPALKVAIHMQLTAGVPRASRRFAPEGFLAPGHALFYTRPAGLPPGRSAHRRATRS
ncbi:protein of unknown function [Acidithiobacillus ferrivorans]|uniref:Uncharacterized protein n=1 Tax=Acidithiobacillus ferrivorans TaxID=160808 RepID=A0ABY1MSD2_9PROT|nr:protein of unknown function [Acidithiobacillus ferrivorans]